MLSTCANWNVYKMLILKYWGLTVHEFFKEPSVLFIKWFIEIFNLTDLPLVLMSLVIKLIKFISECHIDTNPVKHGSILY